MLNINEFFYFWVLNNINISDIAQHVRKCIYFTILNSIRCFSLANNEYNAELSFTFFFIFFLLNVNVQYKWYNNKTQQPDITRAPFKRSFRMTHARHYRLTLWYSFVIFCLAELLILFKHLFCVCQKKIRWWLFFIEKR